MVPLLEDYILYLLPAAFIHFLVSAPSFCAVLIFIIGILGGTWLAENQSPITDIFRQRYRYFEAFLTSAQKSCNCVFHELHK